ncbi:hypothetical protein Q6305_29035, partial [Klebsiella pneumoniae]|nr:hypothetical protein [Klebsiella pneumoniae]
VNPYGGRTEAAAPEAERDEEEGNASIGVSAFLPEVLPDYYNPLELKHPEQYTRPDIRSAEIRYSMINCKISEIWIFCI